MGMSVSWAAVQGAEGEAVLRALGLAETGERDELQLRSFPSGLLTLEGKSMH